MKVLIINDNYYPNIVGGAEISVQKLAEELALSNEVTVLCNGDSRTDGVVNGVSVRHIDVSFKHRNKIEWVLTRSFNIRKQREIFDVISDISPDVIHTNNLHVFTVITWKVAKKLNIPIVHTLRDYTLIGYYSFETFGKRYFSKCVSAVTAPSTFTLNYFVNKGFFSKCKNKCMIPNAIDFDADRLEYLLKYRKQIDSSEPIKFAYLGRISEEKGVDWLIEVFSKIERNCSLHIYGNGELKESTLEIVKDSRSIYQHGFLPEGELLKALEHIDVIIAPSLWDEPFGRIILDAYKSVIPVIITNRGGMPEVVDNNQTGYIISSKNDVELKHAIESFLDRDIIKNMHPNILHKIKQYSISEQAISFSKLYNQVVKNG